jgi:Mn2+/Fe2+ NRAMP family transporter
MAFSNIIAIAIIITTAATLHAHGKTNIETSAQAAEALRPLAGTFAELIFALGIIGTGLLAVPVLAGSTAYAIGEGRKWPVGLSRKPKRAVAFYAVLVFSVLIGIGLNFTPLDPIKALYWSAVINGVLAPPIMILMMLLVGQKSVMGNLRVEGWLYRYGALNRRNGVQRGAWTAPIEYRDIMRKRPAGMIAMISSVCGSTITISHQPLA